jgi:hypothetical protein
VKEGVYIVSKTKQPTTGGGLQSDSVRGKVSHSKSPTEGIEAATARLEQARSMTVQELANLIRADRLARSGQGQRMSWPAYARFMGIAQSTIYKIAQGRVERPHETTVDQILAKIKANPVPA